MWIATDFGYFSIVEKPWDAEAGTLTVRTRVRGDLVTFLNRASSTAAIAEDRDADYHYRAQVPKADVAMILANAVHDIDYANFKEQVYKTQGARRAGIYGRVWGILLGLDDLNPVPLSKTPYQRYLEGVLPEPRD